MEQHEKEQLKKEILEELQGEKHAHIHKKDFRALALTGLLAITFLLGLCVGAANMQTGEHHRTIACHEIHQQ